MIRVVSSQIVCLGQASVRMMGLAVAEDLPRVPSVRLPTAAAPSNALADSL